MDETSERSKERALARDGAKMKVGRSYNATGRGRVGVKPLSPRRMLVNFVSSRAAESRVRAYGRSGFRGGERKIRIPEDVGYRAGRHR